MPEYYKIKDRKDLIKNMNSKAVLTVDSRGLDKYREERDRRLQMSKIVEDNVRLNREVTEMKQSLGEILDLLRNKA